MAILAPSLLCVPTKLSATGFVGCRSSGSRSSLSSLSFLSAQIADTWSCTGRGWSRQWRCVSARSTGGSARAAEAGASVVLTREHGKNGKLMNALGMRGIRCMELPLIEHREGPDLPKLVQTLREIKFEWIIVTSPEAATVFLQAWQEAEFPKVRIAVVGAGTGELFKIEGQNQLDVEFTPSKATAKVLSAELPKLSEGDSHVLYPASLKASDDLETGLTERGFRVTRMNTYSTETVRGLDEAAIATAASAPVATFASPTAVKAWMELVAGVSKWDGAAACIGSTSANAARKAGLQKVFHPESPGIEGWVESIVEALESQAQGAGIAS